MESAENFKVLFVAGFGPIVRDTGESRKLYGEALGIQWKEERRLFSYRSAERRKEFCPVAALPCGAVLFRQRYVPRRHSRPTSLA